MFLQAGIARDGPRSVTETTVYAVAEGDEPAFFTSFFNWDSSKQAAAVSATEAHINAGFIFCCSQIS